MRIKTANVKTLLFAFAFFYVDIIFSELVVRANTIGFADGFPIFMLLFSLSLAFLCATLTAAVGVKARKTVSFVLAFLLFLIFIVQLVYYTFCDSFMSVVQVAMGGDALTNFGEAAKLVVLESLGGILLLFLPMLALMLFSVRKRADKGRTTWQMLLVQIAIFFALHFGAVACLPLGGAQVYSPYDIYHDTFVLGMSERHFGVLTSLRLELRGLLFGTGESDLILIPNETDVPDTTNAIDDPLLPPAIEYDYNRTEIDFDKLLAEEEDESALALHRYFSAQKGTKQNEYTGMFAGYNLIFLCAESFSPYVIDAERTPTLYRMATEGFQFTDYYNSVCDNTSNGEYALLTGLLPDTSLLGKGWKTFYNYNSFTASQENTLYHLRDPQLQLQLLRTAQYASQPRLYVESHVPRAESGGRLADLRPQHDGADAPASARGG